MESKKSRTGSSRLPKQAAAKHQRDRDSAEIESDDDPMQYHIRPKDLSASALDKPREISHLTSNDIFSATLFSSLPIDKKLAATLHSDESTGGMGLKSPTSVQAMVIPELLENRKNLLIKSQTGSGKTLAYLIPIINDLMSIEPKINRAEGCSALILAPTRELCNQIAEVLNRLTKCCVWIVGGCITGGERKKSEKGRLRKGINVLVSTPGRLLDHLNSTDSFNLSKLRWICLDEVDRLLDMGKLGLNNTNFFTKKIYRYEYRSVTSDLCFVL